LTSTETVTSSVTVPPSVETATVTVTGPVRPSTTTITVTVPGAVKTVTAPPVTRTTTVAPGKPGGPVIIDSGSGANAIATPILIPALAGLVALLFGFGLYLRRRNED
ncbi:MAG: hypothetical protein Q4G67_10515, partial [Actinomycetia bacterium]|nr:hypothetical protein [Actinomycetes bacterium]